jgi:energy-coupling factor transporter ATP-binding protein EcfA2
MQAIPLGETTPFRSTDRWTATKRNVKYINTKVDTSAFDRFFYYSDVSVLQEKQEKFIKESERLRHVIDQNLVSKKIGRGEFVFENFLIPKTHIDIINKILGKRYISARYVIHRFYDRNKAASVIFETSSHTYSESFAGSGELAVVNLVLDIEKLSDSDLLLLDEPETSLHPGAQKALLEYILKKTAEKKLQVVISTHSPTLVDLVPDEALVVLEHNEVGVYVRSGADKSSAFFRLGQSDHKKITILTEDILLKAMVERALLKLDRHLQEKCTVVSSATGASEMLSHQAHAFMQANANVILVLDGDQEGYMKLLDVDPDNISAVGAQKLREQFEECHVKLVGLNPDVGAYIKWCKAHVIAIDEVCPEYVFMKILAPTNSKLDTANNQECKKLLRSKLNSLGDDGDSTAVAAIFKHKLGEHSEKLPTKATLDSLAQKIKSHISILTK